MFDTPSADFDEDGDVDGTDFLAWQRGYGTLINAPRSAGDADGDGDVDQDDLEIYRLATSPLPPALASIAHAIPEPATWMVAVVGLSVAAVLRFWRRRSFDPIG